MRLVQPCDYNNHCPPVKSVSLARGGKQFGARLIDFESLMSYLESLSAKQGVQQ